MLLSFIRLSDRNNSYNRLTFSETVTDNQNAQFETYSEHDEAIFIRRMVWVEELDGMLIVKDRACVVEGNTMFFYIGLLLPSIPLEPQLLHNYIVRMN